MAPRWGPGVALGPSPTSSVDVIQSCWWRADAQLTQLTSLVLFCCFVSFGILYLSTLMFFLLHPWATLSQQPYLRLKFCFSHLSTDCFPARPLPVRAMNPWYADSGSCWEKKGYSRYEHFLEYILPSWTGTERVNVFLSCLQTFVRLQFVQQHALKSRCPLEAPECEQLD